MLSALLLGVVAPVPLLGSQPLDAMQFVDVPIDGKSSGTMQKMPGGGPSGQDALRIVSTGSDVEWKVQLLGDVVAPVQKGDVIDLKFWLRAVKPIAGTKAANLSVQFRAKGSDWQTQMAGWSLAAPGEWKQFLLPFRAERDAAKGEGSLQFMLGGPAQTVEIAGIVLTNLGPDADLAALPKTQFTYEGQEPGAAWRRAAEQRIREIRGAEFTVRVVDPQGTPIPNAQVHAQMKRHAFPFGTAMPAARIMAEDATNNRFREEVLRLFNAGTFENDLKSTSYGWSKPDNRATTLRAADYLLAANFQLRGHGPVWPKREYLPDDMKDEQDPKIVGDWLVSYIAGVTGAFDMKMKWWDVVNEIYEQRDLMPFLGGTDLEQVSRWVRAANNAAPNLKLYLNDYTLMERTPGNEKVVQYYIDLIKGLRQQGLKVAGLGMQCHFGERVPSPTQVEALLDRLQKENIEVQITEYDHNVADEQFQADYLRDFLTMTFSHPNVSFFNVWGFWEGSHWLPRGAMLRTDFSVRPNGRVWENLVLGKWKTNVSGRASQFGVYRFPGNFGLYQVDAESGGRSGTAEIWLGPSTREVIVRLR